MRASCGATLGGDTRRCRHHQFVSPEIAFTSLYKWDFQDSEDGFVEHVTCIEVRYDKLNMVEQSAAM